MDLLTAKIVQAGYSKLDDQIITDINFIIKSRELVGLIGPNGAGKSTVIKAILGLLPITIGKVEFTGSGQKYAYIPEQPVFYDNLTLWEHLVLAAAIHEINQKTLFERGNELLTLLSLQDVKHHYPTSFSKGMQQKLMIAIGFLIQPEIYLIDEPFVGLDPPATKTLINLINRERKRGAGIVISTHQLEIAEKICDKIFIILKGSILTRGTFEQIREQCHLPGASLFDCLCQIMEHMK
ncbi:ABC transporter ATP-binding protein [Desulfoscipio sp. XC116]|uniref:ABC transporter ATP-binding protein n=1 Tax=Desulfoscipio sp. XC116 TaxID=3144975 RepID=UPI00325B0EDD